MSFIITIYVNEGIVMASDSRTTYNNTQNVDGRVLERVGVHTTDSTDKTFICPNNSGISTCGDASINGMPITGYIQRFIRENVNSSTDVSEIPPLLIQNFREFNPIPNTNFIVAGYKVENSTLIQKIYHVRVSQNQIEELPTTDSGAKWDGETVTLTKLLQTVAIKFPNGTYSDLPASSVLWNLLCLQDAVDFAKYAVEVTINSMHFQNVVETVGGPVDILVIKPEETIWLNKKALKA